MFGLIEKSFFTIVQKLGLLFATISFLAIIVFGSIGYKKITSQGAGSVMPAIEFSKYQHFLRRQQQTNVGRDLEPQKRLLAQKNSLNRMINTHINSVIESLNQLPDNVIDKNNLGEKITLLVKIKSRTYPQDLQLSYAKLLAELTKEMVKANKDNIQVDGFLQWYDQEFAIQTNPQTKNKALKFGFIQVEKITGLVALAMVAGMLGVFIMFVMMLAVLRIEKSLRK